MLSSQITEQRTRGTADVAVMDLAENAAHDATSIQHADTASLRSLGLSDTHILDVVLAATAHSPFNKTLNAPTVEPSAKYADLDPAPRDALALGRASADP